MPRSRHIAPWVAVLPVIAASASPAAADDCTIVKALAAETPDGWRDIAMRMEEDGTLSVERLGVVDVLAGMAECTLGSVYDRALKCQWRFSGEEEASARMANLHQRLEPCLPETFTLRIGGVRQSGIGYGPGNSLESSVEYENGVEAQVEISHARYGNEGAYRHVVYLQIEWEED